MPSTTEIAQHALDMVNAGVINNIDDEDDPKSAKCKRIYEISLTEALDDDEWKFAKRTVSLAEDATTPAQTWAHQYTLPADCRKPIRLNDADAISFEIMENKILTDASAPVLLTYIMQQTNPNRWPGAFIKYFTNYLAARYAEAFPQDGDKANTKLAEAEQRLGNAIAKNGQLGTPPRPQITTLTTAIRRY